MSLLEQFTATVSAALGEPVASVASEETADATDFEFAKQRGSVGSVGSVQSRNAPPLTATDREAIAEAIGERAAIQEHDAGLDRQEAEVQAETAMRVYQALIAMPDGRPPRWLVALMPGCDPTEARRSLALRFGVGRVLEVIEQRRTPE